MGNSIFLINFTFFNFHVCEMYKGESKRGLQVPNDPRALELLSHPREERTSHRAHAPPPPASCIHQTHTHIQRRPSASGRAPTPGSGVLPLGNAPSAVGDGEDGLAREDSVLRSARGRGLASRTLRCKNTQSKNHQLEISNSKTPPRADCETMFQITKSTVFNKNNLNSFMNPFYFKSLFYCLLMLQFSSSTLYWNY